jgi:hypothetical protein
MLGFSLLSLASPAPVVAAATAEKKHGQDDQYNQGVSAHDFVFLSFSSRTGCAVKDRRSSLSAMRMHLWGRLMLRNDFSICSAGEWSFN